MFICKVGKNKKLLLLVKIIVCGLGDMFIILMMS